MNLICCSTRYPAPEKPRQKRAVIQVLRRLILAPSLKTVAGHGATTEAVAAPPPPQPLSHQRREGAAGSRVQHDPRPGIKQLSHTAAGTDQSNLAAANFLPQCPQVSNWFANARRRLKNVVQETRCSWSKRLRLYNQFVQVIFHPVHQSKKPGEDNT